MSEHKLKTWPRYWDAIASGEKPFEVRRNDRAFQTGDILILEKFDPTTGLYERDGTTPLTPIGYAIESEREPGSVQIYPQSALEPVPVEASHER